MSTAHDHLMEWYEARVRVEELIAQDMWGLAMAVTHDWIPPEYILRLLRR